VKNEFLFVISLILIFLSTFQLKKPLVYWQFFKSWQYKEGSEPSSAHIFLMRTGAVFNIALGLAGLYFAFK